MLKKYRITFAIVSLLVAVVIAYFAVPAIFGSVVAPLPEEYQATIRDKAKKYNVDSCLIAAIINSESRWASRARSYVGAQGLMQIMPATASAVAARFNIPYSRSQITDPNINIEIGTALLRYNIDSYRTLRNVSVAYNAGGGRVRLPDSSLPRETRGYIGKVQRNYDLYSSLYPDFCTGPRVSGGPEVNPTHLPEFVPPAPEPPTNLRIEDFWKALL